MIIDCISDLHGYYPKLEGGDLLIVAGDLTVADDSKQHHDFQIWMSIQKYKKKVLVAGNHDGHLIGGKKRSVLRNHFSDMGIDYLFDSETEFQGYKIWGSPWTQTFYGMNPRCMAFTLDTEDELSKKWEKIPNDIDILITHSPAYGIGDKTCRGPHVGSYSLSEHVGKMKPPKLWVWGHIHEAYGEWTCTKECRLVNASYVNEFYQPLNKPIRVIL